MNRQVFPLLAFVLLLGAGCQTASSDYQEQVYDPELLHGSVRQLTDVMIHDIFSPPQASRAYAYASIAAYEVLVPGHPSYRSLAGQLNGLEPVPQPDTSQALSLPVASIHAFLTVGQALVFSEERLASAREEVHARFRAMGVPKAVLEHSVAYGDQMAQHILAWADQDMYKQTRSYPKFTVTDEPGRWRPTPPAYMDGVEPHWNKLRPFMMDSTGQFKPPPPHPYNMEEGSPFYREVMDVYETGRNLTADEREIANFWDCNPYTMHTQGHAMFATKKITPGGHWMGIGSIAARQTNADLMRTAEVYARVAVALADGFISAWDEKYRSGLIRPETVINQHIDETWRPVLQTPPFPEYSSAHSVISAAAAETLTDLFGEPFAFNDTTEVRFGLPARSFDSFREAAAEAAISRMYGGIHYRMAANNGRAQGQNLGRFLVDQLHTHDDMALARHE